MKYLFQILLASLALSMVMTACKSDKEEDHYIEDVEVDYVDLGLSVNWATFNVGASSPEQIGDCYAWGETRKKIDFSWDTYKWYDVSTKTLTKYNYLDSFGIVDNKRVLELEDDVAHVMWGGSWRMPTREELNELYSNCRWTMTKLNDVLGYEVTSRVAGYEGRSIFLPALTYYDWGSYWSSSLHNTNPQCAYYFRFNLFSHKNHLTGELDEVLFPNSVEYRYYALMTIRPVCPSETWSTDSLSINVNHKSITVFSNAISSLSASVKKNGSYFSFKPIAWASDNPSVATVNQSGMVTAHSPGKAYITASVSNAVTDTCIVTVIEESQIEHTYVDLGLSVKWATFNVGASSPNEKGYHFAWGESVFKKGYNTTSYKWCNNSERALTKYNNDSSFGTVVDNKTELDSDDDAAHVRWGGDWRMPTVEEFVELINNCDWLYIRLKNGIVGYQGTSKKDGYTDSTIFFPAAENNDIFDPKPETDPHYPNWPNGYYWSKSINTDNPAKAWSFRFESKYTMEKTQHMENYNARYNGFSIRPVHP